MPLTSLRLAAKPPTARSRVSNGADILPGVDGRSALARRYRDIISAIVSDMGELGELSEVRAQLCRRFAALAVLAEALEARLANGEQIDLNEHALLSSALVRIAGRLGLDRRGRDITPSLREYLTEGRS